jgi:Protein of unknown function (DUF3800)
VCAKSQFDSRTMQLLVDRGIRWKKVFLVMFRVYIDDSGTDPNQQVAIASALIVPAARIPALDKEWTTLTEKEGFTDFHMSVCVARNAKSQFADWDNEKQLRVISRVRQLGKKFGLKGITLGVKKSDYDELVLPRLEYADKYHYTFVIRNMLDLIDRWGLQANVALPFEYIYDYMDSKKQREAKAEIETVMAQAEEEACEVSLAGRYTNYVFRRRQDIPALQCTDALAWSCYRFSLFAHLQTPLNGIAEDSFSDYNKHQSGTWLYAAGLRRDNLKKWVDAEIKDGRSLQRFKEWKAKGKT